MNGFRMKIPIYQIDAFAEKPFEGNPAAVCPLTEWLPDPILQSIASENNLSETAFFIPRDGYYDLRWFTPVSEVDLCGHATLAAAHTVFSQLDPKVSKIVFQSRSGPLPVSRVEERLTLDFPNQPGTKCPNPEFLEKALGVTPIECYQATDLMAVFDNQAQIEEMEPDFRLLKQIEFRGIIVTAPGKDTDFVSRFFAPRHNIDEDPVTGSAHCTLAPYWSQKLGSLSLSAKQLSKRTGTLHCEVTADRVLISGKTLLYLKGEIFVD